MKKIITLFVLTLIAVISLKVYTDDVSDDLKNGLIRLHIVANSDSGTDQSIKLLVRDACLGEIRKKITDRDTKIYDETKKRDIKLLTETANRVLSENNAPYSAKAYQGEMYFPKKEYKNMTLPAGKYEGVKIVLGNGEGHNWWCVLYPPMCVLDDGGAVMSKEAKKILRKNLAPETYDIITKNSRDAVVKLKIVELAQKIFKK